MKRFNVAITEMFEKVVTVKANNQEDAEQIVASKWYSGQYALGANDSTGNVEFAAYQTKNKIGGIGNIVGKIGSFAGKILKAIPAAVKGVSRLEKEIQGQGARFG